MIMRPASLDKMRLQTRISLLVCLGLVTILGIHTLSGLEVVQSTTDRIVSERQVAAEMTATYVDTILQEATYELAKATTFAPFDPEAGNLGQEQHLMAHAYGNLGNFTQGLMLLDPHGVVVLAQPVEVGKVGSDLSLQPFIRQALESGRPNVSNGFLNPTTGKPAVAVTLPVRRGSGPIKSILVGFIDLTSPQFANSLAHVSRLGPTAHAEIIDANGIILASSDAGHTLQSGEHPEFYRRMLAGEKSAWESTPYMEDGQLAGNHVMAYAPLRSAPWGVGLGSSEEQTFAPVRRLQVEAGVLAALSLAVALVFVWLTTRGVARPIQALIGASKRMASGDLATPIRVRGGAEVGELADTFDQMRLQLDAALNNLTLEKSRYQGIFRSMADPVFTVDTRRRITSFNPAAERMTGWTEAEAVQLRCSDILDSGSGNGSVPCCPSCPLIGCLASRDDSNPARPVARTREGCRVPVETTVAPILDDDGGMVGAVHVLRDISAQEELERMQQQFLSNVSHELRSPLGHVKGYVTTLLRRDAQWDEKTSQRFLREILHGSEKLQDLIDELLDMSRLQAGTFSVERQSLRLGPVIKAAVQRARLQSNRHKFVLNLPRTLPEVLADSHRTEQVLRNLLENAIKYSPGGGSVSVLARHEGDEVIVSVSDEGIGIAEDQLASIFERFHRLDNSLTRQAGGVGLGLSICRSILQAHGGRIWVESRPGQGSSFHFSLPVLANSNNETMKDNRDGQS